jgi:hypothetical protein
MKVASDRPMVLSNRLGGVKDALLLIANPLKPGGRSYSCGSGLAREEVGTFNMDVA